MKSLLVAFSVVLLSACSSAPSWSKGSWEKPNGTQQEFAQDAGQCRAQAFSVPGASNTQISIVYVSCLQGKGWEHLPEGATPRY